VNAAGLRGTLLRWASVLAMLAVTVTTLHAMDGRAKAAGSSERLYFPSGKFLTESALGFREVMADWLWFRFVQYYGAFKKGENDLRYLDLLVDSITRLDPKFIDAYYLVSLIYWSDFGRIDDSYDMLRRGILHNPDKAALPFQIGFMHYVLDQDYPRAAHWFEMASRCHDAGPREVRFAAYARYRAGDDRVSLALWKDLKLNSKSPQMKDLADRMIAKLEHRLKVRDEYGPGFIGPIPEM